MKLYLIATTIAVNTFAITATVTTNLSGHTSAALNKLGDFVGFDAGTISTLGPDCITFTAQPAETPTITFDWGSTY